MTVATLEVPAVYLDDLGLSSSGSPRLQLLARNPEPGEVAVPVGTSLSFTLLDLGGSPGIAVASTQVFIEGVLAFGSGTPMAGYNGAGSGSTVLGGGSAYSQAIVLVPLHPFEPLTVITVRVVASTTDAGAAIDQTWTFTTQDLVAPKLLSAAAAAYDVVRLTFDEPVQQGDGTGEVDALNPANYALQRTTSPAVAAAVASVRAVSATVVELTTDVALSPGAGYAVIVTGVEDLAGNIVAAPNNRAALVGFSCPMPAGRRFNLFDRMPGINRAEDAAGTGALQKFLACLQEPLNLVLCDVDLWTDIIDPDLTTQPFLDRMLADLGNPFPFAEQLEDVDKRRLLQVLVDMYRQKGTAQGIVNVVRFFLGIEVTVQNFAVDGSWELGVSSLGVDTVLAPATSFLRYAFTVTSPVQLTPAQRDQLTQIVLYMKTAHTHFIQFIEPVAPPGPINHIELGLSELGVEWDLH